MNKYNEIMERLTVSDEMKKRLTEGAGKAEQSKGKVIRFATVRRAALIAACFVLLIVGVFVISGINTNENNVAPGGVDTTGSIDKTPWGSVEYKSAAELSKASGIEISDLENLPFKATETIYQDYETGLVEITYSNGADSLSYRVSKGDEDNSGDYNEYGNVYKKEIGGTTVTLKGEGDLIFCALYTRGGYSYSVTSTGGLTLEQLEKMI